MIGRILGAGLFALTRFLVGGHARWQGSAPDPSQRLYFANHASHLDTIILMACLPVSLRATTHPVAAADYWGTSALKRFIALKVLNAVLIERSGGPDPLAPLRDVLSRGHSLILFPEGTRRAEALPGPFKSGIYRLAKDFPEVELVPVYLSNLARAYPKGAILPAPISCSARFGAPIALLPEEERDAFLARAQAAVTGLAERSPA
ncbi:MAG: 1-acyl-sn-glycerol-3-phosphate acyltransferase [Hyphomicrobiaceae bacterium]|nr:1-acyl-sn-glycerol-3-phosphate acyltransferase [Hyphomicrobiaceae bacterium]